MKTTALSLLLTISLANCKEPAKKISAASSAPMASVVVDQTMELTIDGARKSSDPAPVILCHYIDAHVLLGYQSDKDDIQFTVDAYVPDLKPGTYQVYDCKEASDCSDAAPDHKQMAMFGPYPKVPEPPMSMFRIAYNAPKLGLKPLILTITSITDEQQQGRAFKTKRIQGQFSGEMAYLEQERGGYEYHIVGKTTRISGNFSVFCAI